MKTNPRERISVVINTYNAEEHLSSALDSVRDFDEIVVCDMESTDCTVAIAKSMGCRVVVYPKGNISICEPARNFAIRSASNEWVLVLDADEIVTRELRNYLYKRVSDGTCPEGLYIPRRNMFLGEIIHSSDDYQLRMVKRDKVDWPPVIHRPPKIDGRIEYMSRQVRNACLYHLDDARLESRISTMNTYTNYEVEKRGEKRYGVAALLFRPLWFFLRRLFIQGAIRDGLRGLIRAYMAGMYQVILLSKIKEREWQNELSRNNC